jgi:acetyltransferase-like isoleucine patch superfamily enzyme
MGKLKFLLKPLLITIAKIHIKFATFYEKVLVEERLKLANKKTKVKLEGDGTIYEPHNLTIGSEVSIGRNFFIRAAGKVYIGDYTHISRNVVIHTVNHNIDGDFLPYDKSQIKAPVTIGKYVWIGMNVCILPGVTIGDGAVIGMGTVLSKDVLPGEIVVGAKPRVVGRRNNEHTADKIAKSAFLRND